VRSDVDGAVNVIVWLPTETHSALRAELEHRLDLPTDHPDGAEVRLARLEGTVLGSLIANTLPESVVSAFHRRLLGLHPDPDSSRRGIDASQPGNRSDD
jgi:hypothetical protein